MRKYVWTGLLVVAIVAVAGLVHARGGFIGGHHSPVTTSSAPADETPTCPLQCLLNMCGLGN